MLSQRALKALSLSKIAQSQSSFLSISTSCIRQKMKNLDPFISSSDLPKENPEKKLKEWREEFECKEPLIPVNANSSFFQMWRSQVEFTPWGLKKHFKKKQIEEEIAAQRYIPKRHQVLGADLALAYFLIFIGGKVKFKDNDQWISLEVERSSVDLPQTFDPKYIISEIDASECLIYYEGLENFKDCPRVKWASFARCPEIDDWCIDRIVNLFPFIEYLDLSDCPKVSERGIEALYKTGFLQTLIVTNHYKSAAFELTCIMLEDSIPGLQIDIREPKEKMKPPVNEE